MSKRNLLRTQYRKPTHENLKLRLGYHPIFTVDRESQDRQLLGRYEDRFVKTDYKDNKVIQIDKRTGNIYNKEEAIKYINLNKYGTETPDEDYAYLERKRQLDAREKRINKSEKHGPLSIRTALSRKTDSGSTVVEGQHQTHVEKRRSNLVKEREKLAILKEGTSFDVLTLDEAQKDKDQILGKTPPVQVNGKDVNSNKKKLVITQEQIHKALRNSGE